MINNENIKVTRKKIPLEDIYVYTHTFMPEVGSRIYASRVKDRDWRKNRFTNSYTSKSALIKK